MSKKIKYATIFIVVFCRGKVLKAVIQRVLSAELKVDGQTVSSIGRGYVIFLGVGKGDTTDNADYLVKKIPSLRIFEDDGGKINLSVKDVGGEILLVSQFTLFANASHGNRPDFLAAELPDKANDMYLYVADRLKESGVAVKTGVFGADMKITQINDGPFTVILEK